MSLPTPESLAKNGTEDCHQAAFFCWAAQPIQQAKYPEFKHLLFAIPNGGERNIAVAAKMKATGTKAGVLDICLAVPSRVFHGAFIEMKKINKKPSSEQVSFIRAADAQYFSTVVCFDWLEAVRFVEWYMDRL